MSSRLYLFCSSWTTQLFQSGDWWSTVHAPKLNFDIALKVFWVKRKITGDSVINTQKQYIQEILFKYLYGFLVYKN